MRILLNYVAAVTGALTLFLAGPGPATAVEPAQDEELAYGIGLQTYISGYPMMDLYRTLWETSFDPNRGHDRTLNELYRFRRLVTHRDTWVVTPNEDTIYDRAFLDLRNEPIILSIPPMGDRKYWFPIGDMRHDFSTHLSWNTVGARGGDFALCPPGWKGVLPDGVQRIDVSTPIVWILGRYAVDGPDDIPAATALQDKVRLVSLSRWGSSDLSRPAIDPASYPVFTRADLTMEVSTYDVVFHDGAGAPLDGKSRYVLHLGPTPPVDAFWSLTMYSAETFLFVERRINRYSIGDRTRGTVHGSDGSLDVFLQHDEPTDPTERANWLPAPPGPFYLVMRHYSPQARS